MDRSDGYWRVDTGDLTHPVDPFADEPRIPDAVSRSALKKGPEKAKSAKRERPSIVKSWWKEILTWLLATVALLTIVVLLAAFDGKLVRQWHSRVSINTMIAVLAQVEVSALMVSVQASLGQLKWIWFQQQRPLVGMETFDSATRGPEGSVKLLWKMRTSWNPALLGALVTILILGFPPFVQQAVTNSSRKWVLSANNGTIIQALQYHAANVPNPVKVAIHDGFTAQLATPSLVEGRCPSSNCTWAPYTSLGICSSTVDASSQLTKNCTTDQDCTWTIKNDSGLQSPMRFTTKSADDSTNLWISTNVSANGYMGLPDDKFVVSNVSGSFADVYIIYASDIAAASWKSSSRNLAACGNCGLSAIRTTMSVCLQKLQTDMTNGSTSTKKLAADGDITWEGVTARDSNDNNRFLASLWTMADGESLNFTVSYGGLYLLASYIRGQYDGNATLNGNLTSAGVLGGDPSDTTRFLAQDLWGPQLTRYNAKQSLAGIDMRFSNISQTMSNAFRTPNTDDGIKRTFALGKVWDSEPYIKVGFLWLILPLILWLLATFTLITTIYQTWRTGAPIWKSSLLAAIKSQQKPQGVGTISEIKDGAEQEYARLMPTENAWLLSRTDDGNDGPIQLRHLTSG